MSASPIKPGSITVQPNKYVDDALKGQPATIANSSLLTLAEIKTEISEAVEKGVIGITPDERKGLENNTVSFNQLSNMALKMEYSINQKQHLERWNKIWKWLIQMARYESEIIRFANAFERKSILTPLESKEIDGHIERNGLIFAANKFSSLSRDTLYSHEMEWAFIQLAEEIRKFSETGSLPGERNSALIRLQEAIKDMPDVKSILKKDAIGVSVGSPLINPVVKESLFESVKGGARIRFDELERILAGQISRMQEYFASDFIKERFKKLKKAKSYEDKKGILLNYINISGWKEIKVSPEMEAELEDFLAQRFREYYLNAAIEVRDKFSAKDEDEKKEVQKATGQVIDFLEGYETTDLWFDTQLNTVVKAWNTISTATTGSPLTTKQEVEALLRNLSEEMYKELSADKNLSLLEKVIKAREYFANKMNEYDSSAKALFDSQVSRETDKLSAPGGGFGVFVSEQTSRYLRVSDARFKYETLRDTAIYLEERLTKDKKKKAGAASPLIFSSLKVSLKGNLESVASQHALDLEEQFFHGINLSRRFNTNLENEEELNQWLGNAERWLRERIENSSGQFNAWNKDAVKEILNAQLDVIYRHEKHLFI